MKHQFSIGQRVAYLEDYLLQKKNGTPMVRVGTIVSKTTLGKVVDYDCEHHDRNAAWYEIKWDNGMLGAESEGMLVRIPKRKKSK
jgi:hypothetical protein